MAVVIVVVMAVSLTANSTSLDLRAERKVGASRYVTIDSNVTVMTPTISSSPETTR